MNEDYFDIISKSTSIKVSFLINAKCQQDEYIVSLVGALTG